MKDFLKFIVVKTFFEGFRKFITMGAIVYGLYNLGMAPKDSDSLSDFSNFSDEEISEFAKEKNSRLPANSDSLNTSARDRSGVNFRKKNEDFFDNSSGTDSGAQETVNDLVNELEEKANSIDKGRGVSGESTRRPQSSDSEDSDVPDSTDTPALGCVNPDDPGCGSQSSQPSPESLPESQSPRPSPAVTQTPQAPNTISCSSDKAQGLYGASVSLNLSCSETAQIYWCVQIGSGMTCDPYNTPTNYTGTIDLNAGDGIYNLSFYARNNNGDISPVYDFIYTIDSALPALIVNFPLIQVQSTELPFVNETQSTDFGKANHFYHQINLKTHDPTATGLNWNCEDIFNNYASLVTPTALPIQTELATEGLSSGDQIDQSIDAAKISAGDNYVVTLFEDRTRNLFSCQVQKVILEDTFNAAFTGTGSTPVFSGVRKTAGGFVGYGHFQNVPNLTTSGPNENEQGNTVNKSDLFHIVY